MTLFSATLTLVGTAVILVFLDLELALITFLTFPLLLAGSVAFRIASAGAYRLTREKIARRHGVPAGDAVRACGSCARSARSRATRAASAS